MTGTNNRGQAPAGLVSRTRGHVKQELTDAKRTYNQLIWHSRHAGPQAVQGIHDVWMPQIARLAAELATFSNKSRASHSLARGERSAHVDQVTHVPTTDDAHNASTYESDTLDVVCVGQGAILDVGGAPSEKAATGGRGKVIRGTLALTPEKVPENPSLETKVAPATRRRVVTLPANGWEPRPYQIPVLEALDSGTKRAVTVWHRRAGKDHCAMNYTACAAHKRVGIYWHVLPTQRQARKAVWEGIGKDGYRLIDQAFPKELRKRTRDDDMMIEFNNGSIWRCVGGDSFDGLVGSNPIGVVFSEYSIMDPRGWRFTSPILAENDGWAWFIGTPRGKNHFWDIYNDNRNNPEWFTELLTIEHTGVMTPEKVEAEIAAGMPRNLALQEYYCSFEQSNAGTVYGNEMAKVRNSGRVTTVPYDARFPVETWWDIGVRDATAVIFAQRIEGEVRVIDFYQESGEGFPHFANLLRTKPYAYSRHIGPHDLEQRLFISGVSTTQMIAQQFGINFTIAPKVKLTDGVEAGRTMLSRARFDSVKCSELIEALDYYHRKWDEEKQVFDPTPVHDWSSHPCSAWMYGSLVPDTYGITPQWAMAPGGLNTGLSMPAGIPIPGLPHGSNGWAQPNWAQAPNVPWWGVPYGAPPSVPNYGAYDPLQGWR